MTEQTTHPSVKRSIQVVEPEDPKGYIEYKRQVQNSGPDRLRSLSTQMSFRLDEGHGRCIYRIGVEDDGCHSLMTYAQVAESARVLECIAQSLNSIVAERKIIQQEIEMIDGEPVKMKGEPIIGLEPNVLGNAQGQIIVTEQMEHDKKILRKEGFTRAELTIQRIETHILGLSEKSASDLAESTAKLTLDEKSPTSNGSYEKNELSETMSTRNIRIAVVGNVDAGKSTLIGTLTTDTLDDGRGLCRTAIMKHRHEIESGRTSTSSSHLMGFRADGEPIGGRDKVRGAKRKSEDEVARESHRVITLTDLAGHEKYLKTTIHGVSSGFSDYALILVNSRQPPTHMTQHHLNLCCSFGIPVIIVFTKIDGCPEHAFKTCKDEVTKMLRSPEVHKQPFMIKEEKDIETVINSIQNLAPMIETSCVTGHGIDLLQKMMFSLPKRRRHEKKANRSFEFLVEDIFNVPGVGAVVSGFVNAGELHVGSHCNVFVGPCEDGSFMKTIAKTAHIARINTAHVTAGQSACLALALNKEMRKRLRRGMVVLVENPNSTREFDAEICVLKGEGTTIRKSYQAYVHILNVRQSAFAKEIEIVNKSSLGIPSHITARDEEADGIVLRPGARARVRFEFAQRPEYIRPGMRMLFRDGRVRGVGIITGVPDCPEPLIVTK